METMEILILSIFGFIILLCLYGIIRNQQTYNVRTYFNWHTSDYEYLPSYDDMFLSFKPMTKKYWLKWVKEQK